MRQIHKHTYTAVIPCAFWILIFTSAQLGADILFFEGFETDGMDTRYFAPGSFSDGVDDYFIRTDGFTEATGIPAYTGYTGSYFWAAEDIDAAENPTGQAVLDFVNVSLADFPLIQVSLDLAAGSDSAFDSVDDFLLVQYRFDSSDWLTALAFQNSGQVYNGSLYQDTDFDGIGDGTELGLSMQTISSALIPVTGTQMDLRIDTLMTSGSEAIAFDNVQVIGVPEPNAIALVFGVASLLLISRKRFLLSREE